MDDVEITDVDEGDVVVEVDRTPLKNQDLTSVGVMAAELLSAYGWYLLAALVAVYLLVHYRSKKRSRQSLQGVESSHMQDADAVVRRQEAMEASRRRMQEEQDAKAALFREKQKQQEEEKRKQKIEIWESMKLGKSYKGASKHSQSSDDGASSSTFVKPKTDRKSLRSSDYNPLSGEGGGSCSWRPGRRGPSSGG
ncbi:selenoprotein S [Dunckerocampus dactyliophorus]|uniref:selenoprotein S n=1 Tax=Dunckerocampus dactyliophorus TaxID=161453 RepID=UPI002407576D|nr:selenoprotein S [Dunckerocampus dactyliophorus]